MYSWCVLEQVVGVRTLFILGLLFHAALFGLAAPDLPPEVRRSFERFQADDVVFLLSEASLSAELFFNLVSVEKSGQVNPT